MSLMNQLTEKCRDFSKTLSVHPAGNGYPTLFRAGEGKGGEEEEWRSTSVAMSPVQLGTGN